MSQFCIETYINNLPENIEIINVNNKKIKYLPDLTRFTNLQTLHCSNNELTELPNLNENLQTLHCYNNKLTSLPTLNKNLKDLACDNNQLIVLPTLNENLQKLHCYNNRLIMLPILNSTLQDLCYVNNPIHRIIDSNDLFIDLFIINKKLKILHNFCHLYYCLKFKRQFRDLLWKKIREHKIIKKYHPSYLLKCLKDENDDLDMVLDSWV